MLRLLAQLHSRTDSTLVVEPYACSQKRARSILGLLCTYVIYPPVLVLSLTPASSLALPFVFINPPSYLAEGKSFLCLAIQIATTPRTPLCSECTWSDVAVSSPFLPGTIRFNTVAVTAAVIAAASATLGFQAVERAATVQAATAATIAPLATPATALLATAPHALAATAATTATAALVQALATADPAQAATAATTALAALV